MVDVCGDQWSDGLVCCDKSQIDNLKTNLKKAESIIASCPACKENFFQFFCKFTCSPDQSTFVNVTKTGVSKSGQDIVTELNHYTDPKFAEGFYNSCKEVKFGATNGYAMDFIGGGAKDYKGFLKFLGDEKPLLGGSPFQMNFPWDNIPKSIKPKGPVVRNCYDEDYKCACSDCPQSCPQLPKVDEPGDSCNVGVLPCFSFAVLMVYAGSLVLLALGYAGYLAYKKQEERNIESRRLLIDEEEQNSDNFYNHRLSMFNVQSSDRLKSPYGLNTRLQKLFEKLAYFCAKHPLATIGSSIIIVGVLMISLVRLELETSPVRLWVSPDSQEFAEKEFYDDHFGPFYRAEQAYLVNDTGPVMSYDTLEWWFDVERRVKKLTTKNNNDGDGDSLDTLCLKPLGDFCVVESVTQFFGGDINGLDPNKWDQQIDYCSKNPIECLPPFQQPLHMNEIFGGYEDSDPISSKALVVSWVLNNYDEGTKGEQRSIDWELELEGLLLTVQKEAAERGLRLSFNTEMSLEKELNKSSNTDAKIIIISYLVMFIYASIALGGVIPGIGEMSIIKSKFTLGLFGIVIVLLSVAASVGVFAALGVKATLIIAEVIPFLVLAVGVDNIFLLTHELDNVNISHANESVEERISRAVGHIGPSILLSATCETIAFALGSTVTMPAVRNFAIYSAGAVFFNAILQLTTFVSALTLDQKRIEDNRVDFFPFWKIPKRAISRETFSTASARVFGSPGVFEKFQEPTFSKLIRKYYAPYILQKKVKIGVLVVFLAWSFASISGMPFIELGLDQRLAVPNDSYLVDYFDDMYAYLGMGPPVYFVTKDMNATERDTQQALCARFSTCQEFSLANIIEQERKRSEVSFINAPAASWIDDFFTWLNPNLDQCCRVKKDGEGFCSPHAPDRRCETCFANREYNSDMTGLPVGQEFMTFFDEWIQAPSEPCPLGGKAAYGSAVYSTSSNVEASSFRTSHTALRSQTDFINAYSSARRISNMINENTGIETFPYSSFYIFFAQYQTIISDTVELIASALSVIAVVSTILLGSLRTALVVTTVVAAIIVNIVGSMALLGVGLNAVSLVNLVICVGIGVEFCVHIARAFTFTPKVNQSSGVPAVSKGTRSFNALTGVGGSVLGGIALTKLIGVCVLAFTQSKIFDVYYFRMWLSLVIVATLHCFVLLPVLLSWGGGAGYAIDYNDQGIVSDLSERVRGGLSDVVEEEDDDDYHDDNEETL